jgi:hypothetical protein
MYGALGGRARTSGISPDGREIILDFYGPGSFAVCYRLRGWLSGETFRVRRFLLTALFFFALASGACAEVTLTFYSHHFGTYGFGIAFPHAHIGLSGTTEADAKPVKANFGFTAQTISPSILWESVEGAVLSMPDDYMARGQPHLSLPISDEQYRAVLAVVDRWRKYPQPSYNLDKHNCVTFVKEIAIALRLPASNNVKFVRSPKEFLEDLQMRTSKTNRIVARGRPQQPTTSTQPQTSKTKTVRAGN